MGAGGAMSCGGLRRTLELISILPGSRLDLGETFQRITLTLSVCPVLSCHAYSPTSKLREHHAVCVQQVVSVCSGEGREDLNNGREMSLCPRCLTHLPPSTVTRGHAVK